MPHGTVTNLLTLITNYLIFSLIFVRYFFIPSASLLVIISVVVSVPDVYSLLVRVRGLNRISCNR